jgi:lysophospholipase L1-like esterase
VLQCVNGTNFDLKCIGLTINQLAQDLGYIIETLREVAPNAPIVGMNYYNPLLVYWFQDPVVAAFTASLQTQINSALESVYNAYGVPIANVAESFMADDLTTDDTGPNGVPNDIPDSVDLVCAWTWMCSFQNIHANEIGYEIIAQTFYDVLPEIPISKPPRKRIVKHGNR